MLTSGGKDVVGLRWRMKRAASGGKGVVVKSRSLEWPNFPQPVSVQRKDIVNFSYHTASRFTFARVETCGRLLFQQNTDLLLLREGLNAVVRQRHATLYHRLAHVSHVGTKTNRKVTTPITLVSNLESSTDLVFLSWNMRTGNKTFTTTKGDKQRQAVTQKKKKSDDWQGYWFFLFKKNQSTFDL